MFILRYGLNKIDGFKNLDLSCYGAFRDGEIDASKTPLVM